MPIFVIVCHLPAFSLFSCALLLFVFLFWLCQQYCTVQHVRVFDKKKKKRTDFWACRDVFYMTPMLHIFHIPSLNLIHILFFYIPYVLMSIIYFLSRVEYFSTCNSVVSTNKSPLEKVKSYTESHSSPPPTPQSSYYCRSLPST